MEAHLEATSIIEENKTGANTPVLLPARYLYLSTKRV